jgi:hypothetical protein
VKILTTVVRARIDEEIKEVMMKISWNIIRLVLLLICGLLIACTSAQTKKEDRMETVRIIEIPDCKMVSSGIGMFGEEKFDSFN